MSRGFPGRFPNFMFIFWSYVFYLSRSLEVYLLGLNIGGPYYAYLAVSHGSFNLYDSPFLGYVSLDHISA